MSSTTTKWNDGSADWNTPADWSGGQPTSTNLDIAVLDNSITASSYTVTVGSGDTANTIGAGSVEISPTSPTYSITLNITGAFFSNNITVAAGGTLETTNTNFALSTPTPGNGTTIVLNSGGVLNDTADPGSGTEAGNLSNTNIVLQGGTVEVTGVSKNTAEFQPNIISGTGTIEVVGVTGNSLGQSGQFLSLANSGGGAEQFIVNQSGAPVTSSFTTSGGNTFITLTGAPVCFLAGTRIQTPRGEVAVEHLREGDEVMTLRGNEQVASRITWVGSRSVEAASLPPAYAHPVRVRANAFAQGVPHRDVLVTPDHCLFIDERLVPARLLVNGTSVISDTGIISYTYYHIELDRHSILLAEGLPSESYLDTGNRSNFANAEVSALRPRLTVDDGHARWNTDAAAPLAVDEPTVQPIWQRLANRAAALGDVVELPSATTDAGLHLVAGKRKLHPAQVEGGRYVFAVPAGIGAVRLASRAAAPAETRPWLDDRRPLGVAVRRIVQRGGASTFVMEADHPGLTEGWYATEHGGGVSFRWTDGDARIPVRPGTQVIEVDVHTTGTYPAGMTAARKVA